MKKIKILAAIIIAAPGILSIEVSAQTQISSFGPDEVRLTNSIFKTAQDLDISYMLALNPERLLAPYRKSAGLEAKAENYPGWENTGLDGHIGGHYVSALAKMYAYTGNIEILKRLDYMLSQFKECQDKAGNGYLSGIPQGQLLFSQLSKGDVRASGFGLNDRWVPLYNIHKTMAGLRDAYIYCNRKDALEMLTKLCDYFQSSISSLSAEQIQDMLASEHGGLNEIFADMYDFTGNKTYLETAKKLCHKKILEPLENGVDQLTGCHANTQIPKVIGLKRISMLDNDDKEAAGAEFFYNAVTRSRSVSIGGNSAYEHFNPTDDFSAVINSEQGPETCNTYNMLRLAAMLYKTSGNKSYFDYYERALFNHILSSINPVQGGFVYFTPMRHYRVYSQPQTSFWCCVGSGMENHAQYCENIWHHKDNNLYLNLFIPSTLDWKEKQFKIEQRGDLSCNEFVELIVSQTSSKTPVINIRVPQFVNDKEFGILINNKPAKFKIKEGYAAISDKISTGDIIKILLPMHLSIEQATDKSEEYSFVYGPFVLAAKTGTGNQDGLFADESRGGHIASGEKVDLYNLPVLENNDVEISQRIKKITDRSEFKLACIKSGSKDSVLLQPFYKLYQCRYMIYFPKKDVKPVYVNSAPAKVYDEIKCGLQQSESDHFMKSTDNITGYDFKSAYRQTSGSFSYTMKINECKQPKLVVSVIKETFKGAELFVNNKKIGNISGDKNKNYFDIKEFASNETINVEIKAVNGASLKITDLQIVD